MEINMERFTKQVDEIAQGKALQTVLNSQKHYQLENSKIEAVPNGYTGKAVDRLAIFENVYDSLIQSQEKVIADMENLRKEGKTNTVTFKQLMAKKLTNTNTLSMFEIHGLE